MTTANSETATYGAPIMTTEGGVAVGFLPKVYKIGGDSWMWVKIGDAAEINNVTEEDLWDTYCFEARLQRSTGGKPWKLANPLGEGRYEVRDAVDQATGDLYPVKDLGNVMLPAPWCNKLLEPIEKTYQAVRRALYCQPDRPGHELAESWLGNLDGVLEGMSCARLQLLARQINGLPGTDLQVEYRQELLFGQMSLVFRKKFNQVRDVQIDSTLLRGRVDSTQRHVHLW